MSREIELWRVVAGDASLIERAEAVDPADVAAITKLRREYPADVVSVALSLVAARAKAAAKFGELSERLIADVAGVEQASSADVAAYKAQRIAMHLNDQAAVADLCCGIGGDSMALSSAGLSVLAVDRDPLRAWMAVRNSTQRTQGVCADVARLGMNDLPIHLDPARRDEQSGKRSWRLEDYQPGTGVIGALIDRSPAAAIKLSPGVDLEALPWPGEVEFISDRGRLVQAMLWCGGFAEHDRQATLINGADRHHLHGPPTVPSYAPAQRYLYTFDASVERADLIGQLSSKLDAAVVHPRLGLLTSERVIDSPWVVGFELIERLPWRPKRVKQWLGANDGGLAEVKTRGKACDPDIEQRRLRGKGATPYTVFVLRFDTKVQALITRRIQVSTKR
ncbi:MAG: class I SAM-dependent methyltransferase [Phycisphaeraceae bacterium]|nr:class I SAM-dependent methyltransferase [Phycisphaeraceae bacterium]